MTAVTLRRLLKGAPADRVGEALGAWRKEGSGRRQEDVQALVAAMSDEELVEERLQELPRKLADLLDVFLAEPGRVRSVRELFADHGPKYKSRFDLEATLAALGREGFLFAAADPGWTGLDEPGWAVPGELAECIRTLRRRNESEIHETITLKGFLDARYFERQREEGGDAADRGADHARKIYKFYLMEGSLRNRVRQLPETVKQVFLHVLCAHGGLMPAELLTRELDSDEVPDADWIKKCLEEQMLGTVAPLRLARLGIRPAKRAVVLFQEVVLVGLPLYSSTHGVEVDAALCSGVDLVSNVGRFLRELQTSKVQFTVDGELYKASQKRIVRGFLDIAGGFMPPDTQIRYIYRFCLTKRLIDRSGERALRPTGDGLEFERRELDEKLRALLSYAVEEKGLPGEHFHQLHLRRILLRLLKRSEPEQWHEIQFLPFLARNAYLTQLEKQNAEGFFAGRFKGGGYTPTEDLQQICRNLLLFVKRRLYPLGIVDLGMRDGRPVAMRLSRLGADLLGDEPAGQIDGARSTVVVNPDFELILFPGDDEHQAVHAFDRFAHRLKTDHIHHFKLTRESVQSGLRDGVGLGEMLTELEDRSRAPLPQNVVYSLEEWADQAGLIVVDETGRANGRREEVLARFLELPQIAPHVVRRESPTSARLDPSIHWDELHSALRDLGFLIERRGAEEGV